MKIKMDNRAMNYNIPLEGSLGILALGDIGLREWRKIKLESEKEKNEK